MILHKLKFCFLFLCLPFPLFSEFEGRLIHKVNVIAPKDIDISDIRKDLSFFEGQTFSDRKINDIIKVLYLSEQFHNISVHVSPETEQHVNITFVFELARRIESIEFNGNRQFSEFTLLRSILTKKGDVLDESTLADDKLALQELYQDIGYFKTNIQVRFFAPEQAHTIHIMFDIEENEPTRISDFILDSVGKPKSKHLKSLFTIEKGDIFQSSKLKSEILGLKKYFIKNRYLEAKVLPEEITYAEDKSSARIYIKTIPGPQFEFEFKGNMTFSDRILLAPLKEYEETAPEVSLDDIFKHMTSLYKTKGYFQASISHRTYLDKKRNQKLVIFNIQEHEPVTIRGWIVLGNRQFQQNYYEELINENAPPLITDSIYNPDDLEEIAKMIVDHLKTQGFLFAKASVGALNWDAERTSVEPEIIIEEGPQTIIKNIIISGNQHFSTEKILSEFDLPLNTPLNLHEVDQYLKKITDFYMENGFLNFKIPDAGTDKLLVYSPDFRTVTLYLKLEEGEQVRIGNIIFRGNVRTRNRVLERELLVQQGDIWNPRKVQLSESKLLRLGLFSNAKISPLYGAFKGGDNDLLVEIVERMPGLTELGAGYATDDGVRGYAGIAYRNMGGWNRVLSARASFNRPLEEFKFLERDIRFGFSEPYLGGIPFVARFDLAHFKEGSLPFDEKSWKAKFSLDKSFWDFLYFNFQYAYEFRHIFRAIDPNDLQKDFAASIGPAIQLDFRDDPFNPSRGSFHALSTLFYLPSIGSDEKANLYRSLLTTQWYFNPLSQFIIAFSARAGYARSFSTVHSIPVDLRFYLGGRSTIRGFREDIIGSDTKNQKIFENSFLNYRMEFAYTLFSDFGLAFFLDGGNVFFDDIDQPNTVVSDFRHAFGPGLRYKTPIGPLSLDFGFIVSRDQTKGEPLGRLHFSIGRF